MEEERNYRGIGVAFWQLRIFSYKLFRPFFSHFRLTVTDRGIPFSLKSDRAFVAVEEGSRLLSESCLSLPVAVDVGRTVACAPVS